MTKLSDLLEEAALDVGSIGYEASFAGSEYLERARILRAIAPALVAISQTVEQFSELHGGIGNTHIAPDHCPICGLYDALKKAGVSCE